MFGQIFIIRPETGHGPEFYRAIALGDGTATSNGEQRYHALFVDCVHMPTIFAFAKLYVSTQAVPTTQTLKGCYVQRLLCQAYKIKED